MKKAGDLIRMRAFARRPEAGELTIFLAGEEYEKRWTRWGGGTGHVQKRAFDRGLGKLNKIRGEE